MDKSRFSLLLLDPGEIYFEDFSSSFIPPDTTPKTYESKKQDGRLKMCSKSLVFEPKDLNRPLIKIPLKDCKIIEQWKGGAKFLRNENVLSVHCLEYVEMLEGNVVAPYKFKGAANFLFLLNYAKMSDCLPQILQLRRASTLPAAEQQDMIAAIVHSRFARLKFNPLWLDLYEKVVLEMQADKITPLAVNPGRVVLSNSRVYFQPYNNIENCPVLKIELNSIKSIVKRRFLLRHIGIEIYCSEDSSINHLYLSLRSNKERDELYDKMLEMPDLKLNTVEQDVMTLQWQNGIISNYDYLMYINRLGDRTQSDLTQYPVFPWIVCDYTSQTLDINDPKIYRDLIKPIGALNETRLQRLLERYDEMSHPKFLYGSHYSTPGFVLFYLVRLYPHYMLCLQGGRFDHPDRMFNSCADVFKNCLHNMSDFKELIPEFYDVQQEGRFLVNSMGINFGYRHNGVKVGDVQLPPWADSPKDFVQKLRDALESEIVSQNLHNWIDLIFGYKQQGEEAIKAKNLFYYLCYEGNVDLSSVTDLNERHALEVQIMEFGQIPKQVFTVPHPQRKSTLPLLTEPNQICSEQTDTNDKWTDVTSISLYSLFNTHKEAVNSLFIAGERVVSVGHDSKLKVFSLEQNRQIRSANVGSMPLSCCLQLPGTNILAIGSWDNQVTMYNLDYSRVTDSMLTHDDAVTCMKWGEKCNILLTGSTDCTVKLWENLNSDSSPKLIDCLKGHLDHNSHVTCLAFDPDNKSVAVGTEDGEIYIWDLEHMSQLKKHQIHTSCVTGVNFGPDGSTLASCAKDKVFQIMDVNTGMSVFSKALASSILCLKWEGSLILLGCEDGTVSMWDVVNVKLLFQLEAHAGAVKCLDFSPDRDLIVTGGEDRNVKVWKRS